MKPLQNTLYITTPESYLFWENECIAVKIAGVEKVRIPSHTIDTIVCFGNTTVSTPLIRFCGERGIGITFLSENGKFYGRVQGPVNGNVYLRQKQFLAASEPVICSRIAMNFLLGKLLNQKNIIMRAARNCKSEELEMEFHKKAEEIVNLSAELKQPISVDSLRGIEGVAANQYFSCFDYMLKTNDLKFVERSRRPPKNEVNAVLSFVYMLLKNDMQSALESVGLDPACGYLHALKPGRASLALDMMEELRAPLCDRFVISLFNRGQLKKKDFSCELGEYSIEDKARKLILSSWQARKKERIEHIFLKEKIEIGLIPFVQAQLFARVLRGDLDEYPPFIWR